MILTGIFAIMVFNTLDLNVVTQANDELYGIDFSGIESALYSISNSLGYIAQSIASK